MTSSFGVVINSPGHDMDAVEVLSQGEDAGVKQADFDRGVCPFCINDEPLVMVAEYSSPAWVCRECDRIFTILTIN